MDSPASTLRDDISEKKPNPASVGAPAAIARSLVLQSLALWYRTPIKVVCNRGGYEREKIKTVLIYTLLIHESYSGHSGSTT
jgi:hypothetical protein